MTGACFAATPTTSVSGERLFKVRPMPLELRRLDAVLEEGNVRLGGKAFALVLGEVEVGSDEADLGPESIDERELRERGAGRRIDHRAQVQTLARPRDCRAVVARRSRDDGRSAARLVGFDRGQCAAPLERAELVDVFSLQPEREPVVQPPGRPLER
jgi:hypothetical protein